MTKPAPSISPAELVAVLDRALTETVGVSINTSRPDLLKEQMEAARLPRHQGLDITIPSIIEQLFIKRRGSTNV